MLEMMVALVIMSLIGTLVAVQTTKLVRVHRFEKEISDLFIAVQEAQVLAVTYQTDISMDFTRQKEQLRYRLSSDEPFAKPIFDQKSIPLSSGTALAFNKKKSNGCHFEIYSDGNIEPKGILSFSSNQVGTKIDIDFQCGTLMKFKKNAINPAPEGAG